MTTRLRGGGRVRVAEAGRPDGTLLEELAEMTRSSFAVGDMLPGLPAADGVFDTADSIAADMAAGVRLWVAWDEGGAAVGCVRAIPRPDAVWQIRRLAVTLAAQGRGIARVLVRGLEEAAAAAGMRRLVVWALVERGIAPFYSALGYRTTGHFGTPDKPLSEAVMELELAGPRPVLPYPWGGEPVIPHPGLMVTWYGSESRTVAVTGALAPDAPAVLAGQREQVAAVDAEAAFLGGDGWAGCDESQAAAVVGKLAADADSARGSVLVFEQPCVHVKAFTMPRMIAPDLLALWRMPLPRALAH